MNIELITVWPIEPLDPEFYLNASDEEWNAEMARRYGDEWETLDG